MPKFNYGDNVILDCQDNTPTARAIVLSYHDNDYDAYYELKLIDSIYLDDGKVFQEAGEISTGWTEDQLTLDTPPVADFYTVRTGTDPLEVFNDLEKARAYRDGYNKALYYWADIKYAARITIDVNEVQTVTVTKDVE